MADRKLNAKQMLAAKLLFEGWKHVDICESLGFAKRTFERLIATPEFDSEYGKLMAAARAEHSDAVAESAKFHAEMRTETRSLWRECIEKLKSAIAEIEAESAFRKLPPLAKCLKDLNEVAQSTEDSTLGLEELSKQLDGLQT